MSKPRTPKRHAVPTGPAARVAKQGHYTFGLLNAEVASALGEMVADFTVLETLLSELLAKLSGTDDMTAGYIMRALTSPSARAEVMQRLLERAPLNKNRSTAFDEVIQEYRRLNGRRNAYVHGTWLTNDDDGSAWLQERDEHGLALLGARELDASELRALTQQMRTLRVRSFQAQLLDGLVPEAE